MNAKTTALGMVAAIINKAAFCHTVSNSAQADSKSLGTVGVELKLVVDICDGSVQGKGRVTFSIMVRGAFWFRFMRRFLRMELTAVRLT